MKRACEPFARKLEKAKEDGLFRKLRRVSTPQGRLISIDDRQAINFGSNNYLGLADHPEVKRAAIESVERYGWGTGASRLVGGTMAPHVKFEEEIAEFLDKEAALFYGSGYSANTGLLTAILGRGDKVFADRLCHASLLDGVLASGARLFRFAHNDPDSLKKLLNENRGGGKRLIITEGVFSMDGDKAPLREIADLADANGAMLLVDDAHGFGVFGPAGRGMVHSAGVEERVDFHTITAGKSLGSAGGVVAGSRALIDGLVNFSRSFIYSTAPPPASAAAASSALAILSGEEGDKRRKKLKLNIESISANLKESGYNAGRCESQIVPVYPTYKGDCGSDRVDGAQKSGSDTDESHEVCGVFTRRDSDNGGLAELGKRLFDLGVFVPAIRPPTVPVGTARFRLSVMSEHTTDDIEKATMAFVEIS